ncbi:MAG: acylphosphatase [Thermoplasmata archaeon]|nr:acylphosphatase [Thermoplasmata archaeon]
MKIRKRLILDGEVQGVGLRAFAKRLALRLKLKGCARNLEDGTVEIYIEGESARIEQFKTTLRADQTKSMGIVVEKITEWEEGMEGFGTPPPYKGFKIIYDHEVEPAMEELLERTEMIVLGGQELKMTVNEGNKMLGEKIDSMHHDMNERFDRIDAKYGILSETLMGFMAEFRNFNAKLDEHNRKLDLIFERLVSLEEKRKGE